jgi:hypothetical protein
MLERAALRYAGRQQARIVSPSPLLPSDNDDAEVALDSPRLEVDVRWLGRRLEPGDGLPPLSLFDSEWTHSRGEGPGWSANLVYAGKGGYVSLSLWTVRGWKRYRRGVIGRRVFDFPCTKPTLVRASRGRAVVRSTRNSRGASCGSAPARRVFSPDCSIDPNPNARLRPCYATPGKHFVATVHFKDLVITVNAPNCVFCVSGSDYGVFNSAAGMRAIVIGLRAR